MGIEGRVRASIGSGSLHTGVDRSHGRNGLVGFSDGTERGGAQERPGPVQSTQGIGPVRGVLGDAGERQRVERLQQQRSEPTDEHGDIGVDRPHAGVGAETSGFVGGRVEGRLLA